MISGTIHIWIYVVPQDRSHKERADMIKFNSITDSVQGMKENWVVAQRFKSMKTYKFNISESSRKGKIGNENFNKSEMS